MINLICGTVSSSMSLRFMTCMRCGVVRYLLSMYGSILWVGCRKEETRKRENRVNPSFQITATSTCAFGRAHYRRSLLQAVTSFGRAVGRPQGVLVSKLARAFASGDDDLTGKLMSPSTSYHLLDLLLSDGALGASRSFQWTRYESHYVVAVGMNVGRPWWLLIWYTQQRCFILQWNIFQQKKTPSTPGALAHWPLSAGIGYRE